MSMSDEYMILTIERMQIELRRAMEDIQFLTQELQKRTGVATSVATTSGSTTSVATTTAAAPLEAPVKARRVIKLKKAAALPEGDQVVKKPTAIATWNAYVSMIRLDMQTENQEKPKQEDVVAKAKASKDADQAERSRWKRSRLRV